MFTSLANNQERRINTPIIEYNQQIDNISLSHFQQLLLTRLHQSIDNNDVSSKFSWSIYENAPELTKLWILQDQKRLLNNTTTNVNTNTNNNNNNWVDCNDIKQLPNNIKYNIIDFIPSYSLKSKFKQDINQFVEQLGFEYDQVKHLISNFFNPIENIKRINNFELTHVMDTKFQTLHKMRLINREYSKRMKIKILEIDELDLTNCKLTDRSIDFLYFLCFLREQNLHDEKLTNLEDLFIYSNSFELLKSITTENPNNIKENTEFFKIGNSLPTPFSRQQSTPNSSIFGNNIFGNNNLFNSNNNSTNVFDNILPKIEPKTIEEMLNLTNEELEREILRRENLPDAQSKFPFSSNNNGLFTPINSGDINTMMCRKKLYESSMPLELSSLKISNAIFLDSNSSSFNELIQVYENVLQCIGKNNRLKRIAIRTLTNQLLISFSCCEKLKLVEVVEGQISISHTENLLLDKLERVKLLDTTLDSVAKLKLILPSHIEIESLNIITPQALLSNPQLNIVDNNNGSSFNVKEIANLHLQYDCFRKNGYIFGGFANLQHLSLSTLKECIDYFRDYNIPIANIYGFNNFHLINSVELYAYIIYICNTYQCGYFVNSYSEMQVSLEYGWLPCSIGELLLEIDWKSAIECLKILKTRINRKDFILLLRHLLVLYAVNPNQVAIYSLYCYIKSETNDEERRSIIGPVTCKISQDLADKLEDGIKHVTIPMISLNFKNYQFAMELIDEMTPEELEQQNELGDTCLHLQLGYDNEVIEKMIEKQPNLTKILNKQQRSILRARTLEQDHYRYPLILKLLTQYEMDYLQKDIMDIYPLHSENNIPQYAFNPETKTLLNLVQTRNYAFF